MRFILATLLACSLAAGAGADELAIFRLKDGRVSSSPGAPRGPFPVGSLQKPFVLAAWVESHPDKQPPRLTCTGGARCWYRPGHGTLGLVQATALSCNSYFRTLAADVPAATLAARLRAAGFRVEEPISADEAIGLDPGRRIAIEPEALLAAYLRLVREPWPAGESVRRDLLTGLRGAAFSGTAAPLRGLGVWAKTGTAPALSGEPLATSGWVVAIDDAGTATLGVLARGTGRAAAQALARAGSTARSTEPRGGAATTSVTVDLFTLLAPREIVTVNVGSSPVATSSGFVGPGGERRLRPGDRLETGLWRLRVAAHGLERVVLGALACDGRADGTLRLRATVAPREYAAGVIAAEIPDGSPALRLALGSAVLRFLAAGPRHAGADVCDSTHCAYFVGRGRDGSDVPQALDDAQWSSVVAEAARPGPSQWTSHCGGTPLSPHFVWGTDDLAAPRCPLHDPSQTRPWSRLLPAAALARVFGPGLRDLRVAVRDGVWTLEVETASGVEGLRYDDAHRRLATALGWGALPSPATRVARADGGFRAEGVGLGHRVGLCLGESRGYANIAAAWPPPKRP